MSKMVESNYWLVLVSKKIHYHLDYGIHHSRSFIAPLRVKEMDDELVDDRL